MKNIVSVIDREIPPKKQKNSFTMEKHKQKKIIFFTS